MRNPGISESPNDDELQEAVIRDYGWQFEGPFYTGILNTGQFSSLKQE